MHRTLWYRVDNAHWIPTTNRESPQTLSFLGRHARMPHRCAAWMDFRVALRALKYHDVIVEQWMLHLRSFALALYLVVNRENVDVLCKCMDNLSSGLLLLLPCCYSYFFMLCLRVLFVGLFTFDNMYINFNFNFNSYTHMQSRTTRDLQYLKISFRVKNVQSLAKM